MRHRPAPLLLSLLLLLPAACAAPPTPEPPSTPAAAWFVEVKGEGGTWLGPDLLSEMGVDPAADPTPTLRLSHAGRTIPYLPRQTEGGWGLFFFAPDLATRYTQRTALRLDVGRAGENLVPGDSPGADPSSANGLSRLHVEEDLRYLPQAATETPWVWEPLYTPGVVTHTVALPDGLPGPITLTLHLWSHTETPAALDHRLRLTWDGRAVGEWTWDGQGMQHLSAAWDESQPAAAHTLAIEALSLPEADVALVWLDGWDVTYVRRVTAGGDIWEAMGTALQVEDATPGARVLDVTEPLAPRDLGALPGDGLVPTAPHHRYWLGKPELAPAPVTLRPALALEPLGTPAYLVVAPRAFHTALQPLLEHRRAQGLATALVTPQAVCDTYGSGRPDPEAIRALVQGLPSVRYLLLVGDATAEPGGYDGEAGALRVTAPLTRTTVLGETPADALLGTGAGGQPVVAVGRLPGRSDDEVSAMVQKTLAWEAHTAPPTALLLSDNEDKFTAMSKVIGSLLPPEIATRAVSADGKEARAETLDALRQGPTWLNYVGHGSLTLLSNEGVLTIEDGATWREPAVVVAWTCLAAHFVHPTQDAMGETWLRAPKGGAVAFLGPVGETTTEEQRPFMQVFYETLAAGGRLGDAWLAALQAGGAGDVAWGYTLLGDPALVLWN